MTRQEDDLGIKGLNGARIHSSLGGSFGPKIGNLCSCLLQCVDFLSFPVQPLQSLTQGGIPKFSRLFFGPTPLNIRIWGLPNAPADKITSPC
uniref:Uncharacterized protein n=2 Tax=Populus TaxID=3689 RepID=A0A2K1ZE62_POPTR|nr:hypothetical protein [Populus tomentosa]